MATEHDDEAAVLAVNEAFYAAFERNDVDALAATWEHSERAVCTHPGWPILRGWPAVHASWDRILGGPSPLQFILTNVTVAVEGDAAWVTLEENLLEGSRTGAVAALNVFVRTSAGWRMVAHHGSGIVGRA